MRGVRGACQSLAISSAAAVATAVDPAHNSASERSSIESTYESTKYSEYQLKEIKDVYLTYSGPPFNEKDFSPPRPNSTASTSPSAATRSESWHGSENQAWLAQNQRAYSVSSAAVRELARSTLCPSLKTSSSHFCTGLDGSSGSISASMNSLGYSSPLQAAAGESQYPQRGAGGNRPAPLMSQSSFRSRTEASQRGSQRRSRIRTMRGEKEDGESMDRRRRRTGKKAEASTDVGRSGGMREKGRGKRVRREEREEQVETIEEEVQDSKGEVESWGRRRSLSIEENEDEDREPEIRFEVTYLGSEETINHQQTNSNQYSFSSNSGLGEDGFLLETNRRLVLNGGKEAEMDSSLSSSFQQQHRRPRSLLYPTLPPPLSTLSLSYQFGVGEEHTLLPQPVPLSLQRGTSLLSPPSSPSLSSSSSSPSPSSSSSLSAARPTMNDFARKVEGFWISRESQSWSWRSAKDFNRLKKRLRG